MSRLLLLLGLALVVAVPIAGAQTADERAARLSERVMSPFCDGVTLHDCPSAEADELRRDIAQMARDGMTNDQIFERLEADYGPGIRATPDDTVSWLLPALVATGGVVIVALLAKRWARASARSESDDEVRPRISAEDRARLDAELSAYRGEL